MCLYPRLIYNPKYKANKKNGGVIPAVYDSRITKVPIGCGKCKECRKQESIKWQVRLLEDIKIHKNGLFITLTFSTQSIIKLMEYEKTFKDGENKSKYPIKTLKGYDLDNAIATVAVRLFLERWRRKFEKSLRHWLVTELGHNGTENIHLHGIIWTTESIETITKIWKYGYIWPRTEEVRKKNYVNGKTVNYCVGYVKKMDKQHKEYKPIILTSSGIGQNYINTHNSKLNKYQEQNTDQSYTTSTGHKVALPIYWRNKIYSENEREKLWLEKLDKQERWVCGEKVSIKNGMEEYYKLLDFHRARNKQLGYGDDIKRWNRIKYEQERRTIVQNTRIQKYVPPAE